MRPPGWPDRVADPEDADFPESASRWLWDIASLERSADSVWARHPRALAFRVACDLDARVEGARLAYARVRTALADAGVDPEEVLRALEAEAADLQRLQREVTMVAEALGGRRWHARL
jgi:hypothetical protein